jgi:predicted transcriptional regulator of viral defense system
MSSSQRSRNARLAGIVTRAELLAAGRTIPQIRWRAERGALVRLGPGSYAAAVSVARALAVRESGGQLELQAAAALATLAPSTVASHQTAALIYALDMLEQLADVLVVTRPPGSQGSRTGRPGVHVHAAALPASHVTTWHGVPVTTAARTVVDLARMSSFQGGVVVADSALRARLTTKKELREVAATCRGWRGIIRARRVVDFADGRSESPLESISRVALSEAGLPAPDLQVWVGNDLVALGRADFFWAKYHTIGEEDGAVKYANKSRAMTQLRRDTEFREAGFEVVHFGWQEITQTPWQVAASIRAAFQRAKLADSVAASQEGLAPVRQRSADR